MLSPRKPAEKASLVTPPAIGRAIKSSPGRKSAWDMEAGSACLGGLARARFTQHKKPVLLGAGLILVVLIAAVASFINGASPADMAALVAAKLKATSTAGLTVKARASTVAAAAAACLTTTRTPSMRTRPRPPINRPTGRPRTAFDRHMDPVMTPGELLTLQWYASLARTYVEYGSGASTVQAALLAGNALSIENGGTWCKEMLARADVSFWLAQGKLNYVCVDVGATGEKIMGGGLAKERK